MFNDSFVDLGESKIVSPGKKLFRSVYPSCSQQFLGPDQSEFNALFVTNEILSAVPTGHGQVTGAIEFVFGKPGQQTCIFIIRMRRYINTAPSTLSFFILSKISEALMFSGF